MTMKGDNNKLAKLIRYFVTKFLETPNHPQPAGGPLGLLISSFRVTRGQCMSTGHTNRLTRVGSRDAYQSKKQDYEQNCDWCDDQKYLSSRIVQFGEKIARVGCPKIQVVIGAMTKR